MHPRVLKEAASVLIDPLYIIFKCSIDRGKIPKAWKIGTVAAIYKNKGNRHAAETYRPITLTSIACNILESIVRESLISFLKSNNILSDKQFGFRGGRSIVLQLLNVVDHWSKILDSGGTVDAIYCDFQKAFDTVSHDRLMHLLAFYGLPNPILSWIEDFLTDRLQHVSVNGTTSEQFHAPSGVPQGSVLGPVLFIIYINSMILKAGNANIYLYADDLKLYREIKSEEDTELLQKDLDTLYDWSFRKMRCNEIRT